MASSKTTTRNLVTETDADYGLNTLSVSANLGLCQPTFTYGAHGPNEVECGEYEDGSMSGKGLSEIFCGEYWQYADYLRICQNSDRRLVEIRPDAATAIRKMVAEYGTPNPLPGLESVTVYECGSPGATLAAIRDRARAVANWTRYRRPAALRQ